MFNKNECLLVECRDIADRKKSKKLSAEKKLLHLMTSSVSHEMLTPLKCMIHIGKQVVEDSNNSKIKNNVNVMVSTAGFLHT